METRVSPQMSEQEIADAVAKIVSKGSFCKRYNGEDNDRKPKSEYLSRLVQMDDSKLSDECESKIWLSAFASNNPRSDYHWHCDACYDECERREKKEIYSIAHTRVSSR